MEDDVGTPIRVPQMSRVLQDISQLRRSPRIQSKTILEFASPEPTPTRRKSLPKLPTSKTTTKAVGKENEARPVLEEKAVTPLKTPKGRRSLPPFLKKPENVIETKKEENPKIIPRKSPRCKSSVNFEPTNSAAPPDSDLALVPFIAPKAVLEIRISDDENFPTFKIPQKELPKANQPNSRINRLRSEAVVLSNWCFSFVPPNDQIPTKDYPPFVLFGKNLSSNYNGEWCTSIILKVLDKTLFQTYNGKVYSVQGVIHEKAAAKLGYPKDIVDKFVNGFPVSWRNDLRSIHSTISFRLNGYDNPESDSSLPYQPYRDTGNESHWRNQTMMSKAGSDRRNVSQPIKHNTSLMPFNDKVRRTSSGRLVHEPLAYWAGQRVRFNNEGEAVGVEDVSTRTVHTNHTGQINNVAGAYGFKVPQSRAVERDSQRGAVLAVENSSRKRKRKTLVTYSDSSLSDDDENDPYINTLNEISYEDSPVIKKKTKSKRRCIESDDSDDSLLELEQMRKDVIRKEKKRLAKRQRFLEEMERRAMEATRRSKINKEKKKKARELDDDFLEMQEQERLRRTENNYESTETEVSDDGGEWEMSMIKARKKMSKKAKHQSKRTSDLVSDESSNEEQEENDPKELGHGYKRKKNSWKKADIDRLKLALAATVIRRDSDWEKVARSLGGAWTPEECQEAAIKRLKWEPTDEPEPSKTGYIEVTAKQGTIAYQVQAESRGRQYMMGGGSQEDDFFRNNDDALNATFEAPIPDVATFDPNDSLLSAIKTPVVVTQNKRVGKNRLAFVPEGIVDDDVHFSARRSSARRLSVVPDEAREEQQRYMHHLNKQKNQSYNTSRLGTSMFNTTTAGARKKAVHDVTKKIEAIEKNTKGRGKRHNSDISEDDEDDY